MVYGGNMLKIDIPYMPINWNDYINAERRSFYIANNIKQKEKVIVASCSKGKVYDEGYPCKITFKGHYKDHRQDADNLRYKGILDGLVACKVLKNDNLNCIQEIVIKPIFDDKELLEIEIEKLDN